MTSHVLAWMAILQLSVPSASLGLQGGKAESTALVVDSNKLVSCSPTSVCEPQWSSHFGPELETRSDFDY